jgi:hypothetical protein
MKWGSLLQPTKTSFFFFFTSKTVILRLKLEVGLKEKKEEKRVKEKREKKRQRGVEFRLLTSEKENYCVICVKVIQ